MLKVPFSLDKTFLQVMNKLRFLEDLTFDQAPVNFYNFNGRSKNLKILRILRGFGERHMGRTKLLIKEMPKIDRH